MFGALFQGAKFRLIDSTADEQPQLDMDEDTDLCMRIQTFLSTCTTMMSQCSSQRMVDEDTLWAADERSAMRSGALDTPRRLLDVHTVTEAEDAECDQRNVRQQTQ